MQDSLSIENSKSQITSSKQITITKIQNPKLDGLVKSRQSGRSRIESGRSPGYL